MANTLKRRSSFHALQVTVGLASAGDTGAASSSSPCEKPFSAYFFKKTNSRTIEGGDEPMVDIAVGVEKVKFKRVLYESQTLWFTHFEFRKSHWVGVRPKRPAPVVDNMGKIISKRKSDSSWEASARKYLFLRASRILDQDSTAGVEVIANTVTSEVWACMPLDENNNLANDPNREVSFHKPYAYDPNDLPFVKELPALFDMTEPRYEASGARAEKPRTENMGMLAHYRRMSV